MNQFESEIKPGYRFNYLKPNEIIFERKTNNCQQYKAKKKRPWPLLKIYLYNPISLNL
jgi:hypothetical protein